MNKNGFTIIEIMIVVVIISLLAAIAIPSFIKAKKDANAKQEHLKMSLSQKQVLENPVETKETVESANRFSFQEEQHGKYTVVVIKEGDGFINNEYVVVYGYNWAVRIR